MTAPDVMAGDESEEMKNQMSMTSEIALSAREPLWEVVTAVLPIVVAEGEIDVEQFRRQYGSLFGMLGLSAGSARDLALLTGAVETARWVAMSAELAGVDPSVFWSNYLAQMRGVA